MSAEQPISRTIDYAPCRYGSSKIRFRGPARRVRGEYIAFIGGTETFGRFIETPYPSLFEEASGLPSINLGCQNAGVDAFISSPELIDICSMAQATIIQILGAPNMSNRYYTVDPRHNNRFLRASKKFKELYPEVDFSEFDRTDHLLTALAQVGPDRLPQVRQELQTAWVARMRTLLKQIDGKKILLWLADHAPYSAMSGGTICRDPLFVDRAMLNAISAGADAVVEIVASQEEIASGRDRMVFSEFESAEAQDILGPVVHDRVVQDLSALVSHPSSDASPDTSPDTSLEHSEVQIA